MNLLKMFTTEGMVKPSLRQGELPSTKQAYKTSMNMAWPSAVESVLIALISSFDVMMVGALGPAAISAVGITTQPKFILLAVIITLNMGVTAFVARRKGEKDAEGAVRCLKQALVLCVGLALVLNAAGFFFAKEMLVLAGAQNDYLNDAVDYFKIILIGNFFSCMSLTMNAAQRGYGNTRISMITNVTANIVNVIFNWLLINGIWIFPRLGVRGAAIATTIGNVVGFIIALISLLRTNVPLNIRRVRGWNFDSRTMKSVGKVWGSSFVEQIFIRIGFFLYAAMVANLGTTEFATHQVCMQIINISFAFGDGLGIASTSLVGQGLGMKRADIAVLYGKVGQRCALCVGVILSIIFVLLRKQLVGLFSTDEQVITMGATIMFIIAATTLSQTSQVVISGCLRGAGDSAFVALTSFISIGIIRPILSYVLCYPLGLGLVGAWIGLFFDQFLRLILNFIRFSGAKWTKIEL